MRTFQGFDRVVDRSLGQRLLTRKSIRTPAWTVLMSEAGRKVNDAGGKSPLCLIRINADDPWRRRINVLSSSAITVDT
jgi:hypothetical protein